MSKPGIPPTVRVAGAASAVALLALASACSSGKSSSASSPTTASKPPASSAPPAMSGTTVNSASASINGKSTTVLTAPDGHTLYYFTPDTAAGKPTCTGTCAATWPALMATNPSESTTATGALTVVNGQVAYNGHPLYEYSGDSAAGQTNGEGFMGKWYVATPTLAAGAGPGNPMPSSPGTSGGGSSGGGGGSY